MEHFTTELAVVMKITLPPKRLDDVRDFIQTQCTHFPLTHYNFDSYELEGGEHGYFEIVLSIPDAIVVSQWLIKQGIPVGQYQTIVSEDGVEYPLHITDKIFSDEHPPAIWRFCGSFPLSLMADGKRRAARYYWRSPEDFEIDEDGDGPMNAAWLDFTNPENPLKITLEVEYLRDSEDSPDCHVTIDDIRSRDWYIEVLPDDPGYVEATP